MRGSLAILPALALCALADELPTADRPAFSPYAGNSRSDAFIEQFTDDWTSRWSPSEATKKTPVGGETMSYVGKWEVKEPTVFPGLVGDKALVATSKAAHHAISASLDEPIDLAASPVVVQYEVKLQNGLECGGAYMKLLSESDSGIQAEEFSDKTEYSIMFGPDKCGATNKVHLILRHKNPKTGEVEEKHLKAPPQPRISKTTTLYTLHLEPSDQSYEIFINEVSAKKGLLAEDFSPAFVPEAEIEDPEDVKPADWVDAAKITDSEATKPDDWDETAPLEIPDEDAVMPDGWLENEPTTIPDPDAEKPEEWDDEEDGDWVAPTVPNPKCEEAPGCGPWVRPSKANPDYKGKWYAPLIDNPLFKGVWKARKIANPAYYEDKNHLAGVEKIAAVGFEIWSMQSDITFDNIYVGKSLDEAKAFAKATFSDKKPIEDAADKASKPADSHKHTESGTPFDLELLKADPLGYSKAKALEFVDDLKTDFVGTLKGQPQTSAVFGGILAMLVGLIGIVLSLLSPKPKVVKKKASEAVKSTKVQAAKANEEVKAAASEAIATAQKNSEELKKRAAAGKAKAEE